MNDQLASISYSDSPNQWLYSYNSFGFLLSIITDTSLSGGSVVSSINLTWSYDSAGRAIANQVGVVASPTTVAYDDTTGNRTVPAAVETFTYDSKGYLASTTDWNGNRTTYVNDSHGQPTSLTEASGTPLARTTTITYDTTFLHLPARIVAPRRTTAFTYDRSGNLQTRTETDTSGGPSNGQVHTWTFTSGSFGHLLSVTGPRTDVVATTRYTYSGNNLATITDALGHVSNDTSYTASGLPLSFTGPNGILTTYTYDLENRLLSSTIHAASGNATTAYTYPLLTNTGSTPAQVTFPDGSWLGFQYDLAGQIVRVSDSLNDATIQYTRDANEDVLLRQIVSSGGAVLETRSAAYDSLGHVVQQIVALSQATTFTYDADGNTLSIRDARGNTTTSTYDALNRQVTSVDHLNNTTPLPMIRRIISCA